MNKRWQIIITAVLLVTGLLLAAGCGSRDAGTKTGSGKLKVVATVYPVYEFVKQVGGDKVEATVLIPPGAEPHDWEPTAKDMMKIKEAKVFVYHGAGLEAMDKLLSKEVTGNAAAVEASKGVASLVAKQDDDDHDHDKHDHDKAVQGKGKKHNHGSDAHMWLDPRRAQQEVDNITAALVAADEANAGYYRENAAKYKEQLAALDEKFTQRLSRVSSKEIVTSHEAFGYLADRYGLKQLGIMGLSPDAEPTPDKLAQITRFCREHQVKYIFFETIASPKLAQTLAKETGAGLLVLNPVENLTEEEMKQGKTYLSIMEENLNNLEQALR